MQQHLQPRAGALVNGLGTKHRMTCLLGSATQSCRMGSGSMAAPWLRRPQHVAWLSLQARWWACHRAALISCPVKSVSLRSLDRWSGAARLLPGTITWALGAPLRQLRGTRCPSVRWLPLLRGSPCAPCRPPWTLGRRGRRHRQRRSPPQAMPCRRTAPRPHVLACCQATPPEAPLSAQASPASRSLPRSGPSPGQSWAALARALRPGHRRSRGGKLPTCRGPAALHTTCRWRRRGHAQRTCLTPRQAPSRCTTCRRTSRHRARLQRTGSRPPRPGSCCA
mmetsp:Transcript_117533/g.379296  ORF Transcript_117533/g.379296 Transcript_117533/m.379296 type:complete len:280 (+) Transcript_117533:118-957(+)